MKLRAWPGVASVAAFGNALHLASLDEALLAPRVQALEQQGFAVQRVDASLEDVFINLMRRA